MVDLQCIFDRSLVLRSECKSSLGIFWGWMTKLQNTVTNIMLYSNVEFSVCIINKELTRVVMQWFDLFCIELNFVRIHNFWRPQFRLSKTIPNRMISFDPTSERPAGHASRKCHFGRDKNWNNHCAIGVNENISGLGNLKSFLVNRFSYFRFPQTRIIWNHSKVQYKSSLSKSHPENYEN